jgi:hypothetical protein
MRGARKERHVLGALALEALWGDKTLDLGAACLLLLALLLDLAANDVLADVCRSGWRISHRPTQQIRVVLEHMEAKCTRTTREYQRTVLLGEVEELADLAGTLGTETAWLGDVCSAKTKTFSIQE